MDHTQYAQCLTESSLERVGGSIERVTFHNPENGFCVLRVKAPGHRDVVTVTGFVATVTAGEYIEALGNWISDKTHGMQFKATQLRAIPPSTLEGIERYLSSGMVKGIGAHFAKQLVKAFGEQVFDVIEQTPERLSELAGIGKMRKERIIQAWSEQKAVRNIMVFLQSHGIGTTRAVRIYKTYGELAIQTVSENPYRLALDIHGFGFKTVDELAQKLGISADSVQRAQAGIRHVLQLASTEGHCALKRQNLIASATQLLAIPEEIVNQALTDELMQQNLIAEDINNEPSIFLAPLYHTEVNIANHVQRLLKYSLPQAIIDSNKAIPWVEEKINIQLSTSQKAAIELTLASKIAIITGGPGVGKTTIVNSIIQIMRAKKFAVTLCAPTGRAAKRLAEVTSYPAKTIHRLLNYKPKNGEFLYNADNPLPVDFIVIDEVSMVDLYLMHQLLRAIPDHARVLFVGDVDQLPSVGPGAVLIDFISSKCIPTAHLTEIFRQAASSHIIVNAHRLNEGKMPLAVKKGELSDFYFIPADTPEEIHQKVMYLVTQKIPNRFHLHPIDDIQVLTPTNRGGLGARALNASLQAALNANSQPKINRYGWTFSPGDKVIQTVNNYDKEVFNGDIGRISSIDLDENELTINFDSREVVYDVNELDEIALAYATTIHKSQGSEYPAVVIPIAMQHFTLLERNLIYTGVTRGKKLVIIVGEKKALAIAVHNQRAQLRITNLSARLINGEVEGFLAD